MLIIVFTLMKKIMKMGAMAMPLVMVSMMITFICN
jgi:hypothetical protein